MYLEILKSRIPETQKWHHNALAFQSFPSRVQSEILHLIGFWSQSALSIRLITTSNRLNINTTHNNYHLVTTTTTILLLQQRFTTSNTNDAQLQLPLHLSDSQITQQSSTISQNLMSHFLSDRKSSHRGEINQKISSDINQIRLLIRNHFLLPSPLLPAFSNLPHPIPSCPFSN